MRRLAHPKVLALTAGLVLAGTAVVLPARAGASRPVPADVAYYPDLVYRTVAGQELRLDLAFPRGGSGSCPAVVIIHGTGPLNRGRKANVPLVLDLARAGYVAAAVSYRFSPAEAFPAAVEDLHAAVRWLRLNSGKYRINPERFAAVGFSGGGSLACLLGMAGPRDGLGAASGLTGPSGQVQAIVSYFAPTDLARLHATALSWLASNSLRDNLRGLYVRSALEKWLGGAPTKVPERYARASPITYARKGAPPTLLIHGTADAVVPAEQSRLLARKLHEAGGAVRLLLLDQAPHDFDELNDANARQAAAAVRAFLAEHLTTAGAAKK
jgi:acetyl esterase/lipase